MIKYLNHDRRECHVMLDQITHIEPDYYGRYCFIHLASGARIETSEQEEVIAKRIQDALAAQPVKQIESISNPDGGQFLEFMAWLESEYRTHFSSRHDVSNLG